MAAESPGRSRVTRPLKKGSTREGRAEREAFEPKGSNRSFLFFRLVRRRESPGSLASGGTPGSLVPCQRTKKFFL